MPRTVRLLPAIAIAALVLAGCVPGDPLPTPPPSSGSAPVFATEAEALAAAEEAYGAYLATVDAILADGGQNPERLQPLSSEALYEREARGFADLAAQGWRGIGTRTFTLSLQLYNDHEVVVYSCDDVSYTDIVDAAGNSVVATDRQDRYAFEVVVGTQNSDLIVLSKDLWEGGGVC